MCLPCQCLWLLGFALVLLYSCTTTFCRVKLCSELLTLKVAPLNHHYCYAHDGQQLGLSFGKALFKWSQLPRNNTCPARNSTIVYPWSQWPSQSHHFYWRWRIACSWGESRGGAFAADVWNQATTCHGTLNMLVLVKHISHFLHHRIQLYTETVSPSSTWTR